MVDPMIDFEHFMNTLFMRPRTRDYCLRQAAVRDLAGDYYIRGYEDDYDFFDTLIEKSPYMLPMASERLRNDRHLISKALKISPVLFIHWSNRIGNDKEFALMALSSGQKYIFGWIAEELRSDPDIIEEALNQNMNYWDRVPQHIKDEYESPENFLLLCGTSRQIKG